MSNGSSGIIAYGCQKSGSSTLSIRKNTVAWYSRSKIVLKGDDLHCLFISLKRENQMSKKVIFYLFLDLIGVGITLLVRMLLCNAAIGVSDPFIQNVIVLIINVVAIAICLFVLFFFLLYWWADRKWKSVKKNLRSLKHYIKRN